MKKWFVPALLVLLSPCLLRAYEYKLQNPPGVAHPPGIAVNGLDVIKVTNTSAVVFNADGTISASITSSVRICGVRICVGTDYFCTPGNTWDNQGNLLTPGTTITGACPPEAPIETIGSEQVHGINGSELVGFDVRGYGFVAYPTSHYVWTTDVQYVICGVYYCQVYVTQPNGGSQVVPIAPPTTFLVQLTSDGDLPLNITAADITVLVSGDITVGTGTGTVDPASSCLSGPIVPGTSCTFSVTFDPSTIVSTSSAQGYAYNVLYLNPVSDAGNLLPWSGHFTVTGFPVPSSDDSD